MKLFTIQHHPFFFERYVYGSYVFITIFDISFQSSDSQSFSLISIIN